MRRTKPEHVHKNFKTNSEPMSPVFLHAHTHTHTQTCRGTLPARRFPTCSLIKHRTRWGSASRSIGCTRPQKRANHGIYIQGSQVLKTGKSDISISTPPPPTPERNFRISVSHTQFLDALFSLVAGLNLTQIQQIRFFF